MRKYTRETLGRADGLHADCARDLILAQEWGYPKDGVAYVFPGNGGVRSEYFHQREGNELGDSALKELLLEIPPDRPVIVNPRGFRAYIRNDTFFKAIPGILEARPGAVFLCPAMKGVRQASEWVRKLGVEQSVRLLPTLNPAEMGAVFRRSQVAVSLAEHDGTPNTLLEAMACGSFPVASDLESIREWIEEAVNGFLVDPGSPGEVCEAVLRALEDSWIRDRASGHNTQIIAERATFSRIMPRMESNYDKLARIPPREAR
jgi:glycosyltransferase involved in cell wall biosynthesis